MLLCFIEVTRYFKIDYKETLMLAVRFYIAMNSLVSYYGHILKNSKPVNDFSARLETLPHCCIIFVHCRLLNYSFHSVLQCVHKILRFDTV